MTKENLWMVYMENPIKMDDLGVHLFWETHIYKYGGGWTNPSERYARQIGSFPQNRDEQKKAIWVATTLLLQSLNEHLQNAIRCLPVHQKICWHAKSLWETAFAFSIIVQQYFCTRQSPSSPHTSTALKNPTIYTDYWWKKSSKITPGMFLAKTHQKILCSPVQSLFVSLFRSINRYIYIYNKL